MHRAAFLLLLPLVGALPFVAAEPATHDVRILGSGNLATFHPIVLLVRAGDSVVWTNDDIGGSPHVATGANAGEGFDTGFLYPGDVSEPVLFPQAGEYHYHCPLHGSMRYAQVRVI